MVNIFDPNFKLYNDKVSVRLSRKIFNDKVKCCLEAAKKDKKCPNFEREDHKYSRKVSNALDEVVEVCQILCIPPVMLNSYSVTPLWSKYFSQSTYMKYHIENWYISVIRLESMFLILTNEVFQLGIKKELIGYEIIVTNGNIPDIVKKNLKNLHKAIKHIRTARIMLIHHQTLYEKKLDEIKKDENIVRIIRDGGKAKEIEKDLKIIEFFAKKFKTPAYRRSKRNSMLKSNSSLLGYISEMLLVFEKFFEKNHKDLLEKRKK